MKNFDKIIALIDKINLTADDEKSLEILLNEHSENREFYNTYKKLKNSFQSSRHLTIDELRDHVLVKNRLEPENHEVLKYIPLFDEHIRNCSKCTNEMKFFDREFSDVENFLSAQFDSSQSIAAITQPKPLVSPKMNYSRYTFVGLSAMVFLFMIIIVASNLTTSEYYKLAAIDFSTETSISRGRSTNDFELSIKALEEHDYDTAIEFLQNDIKQNKSDETIFYSHYILGLTYLETAEKSLFGLFPLFDKTTAQLAKDNFLKTIDLNTSGKFQNVNLDAYFYAAKASLMLDNKDTAKEYLSIVIKEKGSKLNAAGEILKELN